jgi:hypothetical protein
MGLLRREASGRNCSGVRPYTDRNQRPAASTLSVFSEPGAATPSANAGLMPRRRPPRRLTATSSPNSTPGRSTAAAGTMSLCAPPAPSSTPSLRRPARPGHAGELSAKLRFPMFVKRANLGSSVAIPKPTAASSPPTSRPPRRMSSKMGTQRRPLCHLHQPIELALDRHKRKKPTKFTR